MMCTCAVCREHRHRGCRLLLHTTLGTAWLPSVSPRVSDYYSVNISASPAEGARPDHSTAPITLTSDRTARHPLCGGGHKHPVWHIMGYLWDPTRCEARRPVCVMGTLAGCGAKRSVCVMGTLAGCGARRPVCVMGTLAGYRARLPAPKDIEGQGSTTLAASLV
ncbi:hypothetical protein E2C01_003906 [Portunus trituberculatus]|uniref:Uncharacterized protein n=1 Tax=Portunus trituberculatus TaxID=210409 RepID=A0A5B7CRF7_PORTR|nr:hypothetical protein [Portunus trituberculatus]